MTTKTQVLSSDGRFPGILDKFSDLLCTQNASVEGAIEKCWRFSKRTRSEMRGISILSSSQNARFTSYEIFILICAIIRPRFNGDEREESEGFRSVKNS